MVNAWAQNLLSALPVRTLVLHGGDLNSGLGLSADGTAWERGIGDSNPGKTAVGSESWESFFAGNDYGVATTYASKVRATYCGDKGAGSVTDYLVVNGAAAAKTKRGCPGAKRECFS